MFRKECWRIVVRFCEMKLFRYMSYEHWVDTVIGKGFAMQCPSNFDDTFEGRGNLGANVILDGSAFDSCYSILCLNKNGETDKDGEMLMWSLYADHSRGVRIALDLPNEKIWPTTVTGLNVDYDNSISRVSGLRFASLLLMRRDFGMDEIGVLKDLYGTKPSCWAWEKEFRLVAKNIPTADISVSEYNSPLPDGRREIFFATFLKKYITGVDFGLRVGERIAHSDMDRVTAHGVQLKYRMAKCCRNEKSFVYQEI